MSESSRVEQLNSEIESYLNYRNQLVEGETKVSEGLDKAVLAISSAGLGLTFTLFDKLYIKGNVDSLIFAKSSWLFFVISVFFVLSSLLFSGHLYYRNRELSDSIIQNRMSIISALQNRISIISAIQNEDDDVPEEEVFSENKKLVLIARLSHYFGAIALFLAIAMFGLFVFHNTDFKKLESNQVTEIGQPTNTLEIKENE
ncbi:hypothetical protein KO533_19130 [Shewanella sp. NKUCC05_KAH]|uniref:hypothetical protein n=1 Tax=Shewanella sp. NKUCC05_KAH TaxID=2842126 RepID=UPI001C5B83C5|nr:hypothetical protein [Shewanella sp. NKUCC05_KAH]MBW3528662.1 hypothetical protein [Shewanella sp. NKUCC05_KAH]